MPGKGDKRPLDRRIADLADRQHGVVEYSQLLALGLTRWAIEERVRQGRLFRLFRGVYAVGRRNVNREGWWRAATLTAGEGAVLSYRSAGGLWTVTKRIALIEVTVCGTGGRSRRKGLTIHRTSSLPPDEVAVRDGIPVTTLPRSLLDLAEVLSRRELERALDEAQFQRLLNLDASWRVVDRHPGRAGASRLARALDEHVIGTTRTNEGLEERFFTLIRGAGLPEPLVKEKVGPYELDFLWPDARLVVETDDRASHERLATYETDRERDAFLDDAGYRVRRFTWRKVTREPDEVIATVRWLLEDGSRGDFPWDVPGKLDKRPG